MDTRADYIAAKVADVEAQRAMVWRNIQICQRMGAPVRRELTDALAMQEARLAVLTFCQEADADAICHRRHEIASELECLAGPDALACVRGFTAGLPPTVIRAIACLELLDAAVTGPEAP